MIFTRLHYSNLRFYCSLNGGLGTLAMPYPLQSQPTSNTRQGTLLGIHLLKQMDTQDPHANHFGYFQLAVPLARVSEISSFISGIHLLKQMDTQDPHAHHFGCFQSTVSQARVSEISSFISGIHLQANGYARPSRPSLWQFSAHCFAGKSVGVVKFILQANPCIAVQPTIG